MTDFPLATSGFLPVKRLGYDCREILQTAISIIDRQRRGACDLEISLAERHGTVKQNTVGPHNLTAGTRDAAPRSHDRVQF